MSKNIVWVASKGDYYDDENSPFFVAFLLSTVEKHLESLGYRHDKSQKIWLNDSTGFWVRLTQVEIVYGEQKPLDYAGTE